MKSLPPASSGGNVLVVVVAMTSDGIIKEEMFNYKLTIEYEGTNYQGWQKQKSKATIQGVIEETLSKIFKKEIKIIGQGRTDSGVHALGQVAHFKVEKEFTPLVLRKALNSLLPPDIKIKNIEIKGENFHSRYSAKSRHYRYLVYQNDESLMWLRRYAHFYPYNLDIEKMKKGASFLIGEHDFSSFENRNSKTTNSIRKIISIKISEQLGSFFDFPTARPEHPECSEREGGEGAHKLIVFDIKANAFLYRMVRNIVSILLDVGRGKIPPEEVRKILKLKDRTKISPSPAYGLFLVKVEY